ncbi:MAG: general secretion pathway protein GspK [Candidatus Hydrogenedentes bacterium]|nr:general secretion pathway protein GspK [Candidatus Hydrogenedentota bacterium]
MKRREHGFVLVAVIWMLAILTVLAIGFGRRALLEQRAAALSIDHTRTQHLARGAVEYGIAYMRNQALVQQLVEQYGGDSYIAVYQTQKNMLTEGNFFDLGSDALLENDQVTFTLEDAEGKISLNSAPREIFDEIDILSFTTVSAILRRRGGPLGNDEPMPFLAIDEARLLEGISDSDWYGSKDRPGLRDLFTIYGDGRVNVNTAPREVLESLPDLDPAVAAVVLSYRAGADGEMETADDRRFQDVEEIASVTGVRMNDLEPIARFCKFESEYFTITGFATLRQGKVRAVSKATVQVANGTATVLNWSEGDFGS